MMVRSSVLSRQRSLHAPGWCQQMCCSGGSSTTTSGSSTAGRDGRPFSPGGVGTFSTRRSHLIVRRMSSICRSSGLRSSRQQARSFSSVGNHARRTSSLAASAAARALVSISLR